MRKNVFLVLLVAAFPFFINSTYAQEESIVSAATNTKKIGQILVYENFADLEPLFNKQTDTTYVINFWATWCKPCVEELPYFEQLHDAHKNDKLKVILVSLDFPKHLESKLLPFVEKYQLKSDVIALTDIDFNSWIDKVSPEWSGAIPVTMVYNAREKKFINEQFADFKELNTIVQSLL